MTQEITLHLTVDQVNVVIGTLAKAPFETVADLIALIRSQAIPQLQAAQAPAPEAAGDAAA